MGDDDRKRTRQPASRPGVDDRPRRARGHRWVRVDHDRDWGSDTRRIRFDALTRFYRTLDVLTGDPLPAGAEGELAARGPTTMLGFYGEIGVAWVVARPGVEVTADELVELCRARLARFKVPRRVLFLAAEDLPTTPTGKVQKFRLARMATERAKIRA